MKDIVTPVAVEEIHRFLKKALENAALINYTKISEQAKIEGDLVVISILKIIFFNLIKCTELGLVIFLFIWKLAKLSD